MIEDSQPRLVIGLGNPGIRYRNTRHNFGARVVEGIAKKQKVKLKQSRSLKSKIAFFETEARLCLLAVPQAYMNCSGEAVGLLLKQNRFSPRDMLVVYDDLDLDLGVIRFKRRGSSAGHNGIQSVMDHLNTDEFNRLRLGIGKPKHKEWVVDYVLSSFSRGEGQAVDLVIRNSIDACMAWVEQGIEKTMNIFN